MSYRCVSPSPCSHSLAGVVLVSQPYRDTYGTGLGGFPAVNCAQQLLFLRRHFTSQERIVSSEDIAEKLQDVVVRV